MKTKDKVILIGYSGHAFVVCDIFLSQNFSIIGYCEQQEKSINPFHLTFLGQETSKSVFKQLKIANYFTAIGNNNIRKKVDLLLEKETQRSPINAIHKLSSISSTATLGKGILVGNGAIVNACVTIHNGVICNTHCTIEHECTIGEYSHIAPGAVLCGNVTIGKNSFIGAGSVVKQGIKIGDNVVIGAGAVIIRDIADNSKVVGNPQRSIL